MITDYQTISILHDQIQAVILWDERIWLDQTQLQAVLQVNKSKLLRMLNKVKTSMDIYPHSELFSEVKVRRKNHKELECVCQIRCYDEAVVNALLNQQKTHRPHVLSVIKEIPKANKQALHDSVDN